MIKKFVLLLKSSTPPQWQLHYLTEVDVKEVAYALSRGSTGSSTTGLSTGSSLSLLTRGASKSLNSSGALEKKARLLKTQITQNGKLMARCVYYVF